MDVELNLKAENYQRDLAITINAAEKGAQRVETQNKKLAESYETASEKAKKFIDRQRNLNSNSKSLAEGMAKIAAAGLAVGKSVSYFQNMTAELDGIGKTSRNLDMTAEQLQGLRYAAKSANFDAAKLESVFARMQNVIGGAMSGDSGAVKKLQDIGLEIEDLQGKNPYEIFEKIAAALTSINDPAERTRAGIAIFGKEFVKMNELLRTYAMSVETAKASGMIISNEAVAAAERYQQVLTDIDTSIKALIANSDALKNLSGWLAELQAGAMNNAGAKAIGFKSRREAVDESIAHAEKSGKYTPEQIEKMRAVSGSYAKRTSEFWIGRRYKGAYGNIDSALRDAGYGDIARINGKHQGGDYVMKKKSPDEVKSELIAARKRMEKKYSDEFDRNMRRNMAQAAQDSEAGKGNLDPEQARVEREGAKIDAEIKSMRDEEKVLDLLLEGKQKEAALQREINELRRDGVLSERNAEILARRKMEIEEKRKQIAAEDYLKKQAEAVEPKKDKKAAEIDRMTKEMEKILGDKVPREMRKQIEQIADLKVKIEAPKEKPKIAEKPASINHLVDAGGMRLNRPMVNIKEYNNSVAENKQRKAEIEKSAQNLKNWKPKRDVIDWGPEPKRPKKKDQTYTVSGEPEKVSIPQVADQSYTIRGNVDAPEIPVPEDQDYTVTGTVDSPEIPQVEDQQFAVTADVSQAEAALSDLSVSSDLSDKKFTIRAEVDSPEIPEVEDQSYEVTGTVDSPDIPALEDQTYNVTANVEAPDIPDIPEQTVDIHFRDTAGFIDKLRTMQANLDSASSNAMPTKRDVVPAVSQSSITGLKQGIDKLLNKENDILSALRMIVAAYSE